MKRSTLILENGLSYAQWVDRIYREEEQAGRVTDFSEEFYAKMRDKCAACIPIELEIRYLMPKHGPGKCMERSTLMFYCHDDAVLVRGKMLTIRSRYLDSDGWHGWIEIGDHVYDPSTQKCYPRDLYYRFERPAELHKVTHAEYATGGGHDYPILCSVADLAPGGYKRSMVGLLMPFYDNQADEPGNEEFRAKLTEFQRLIDYDPERYFDEILELQREQIANMLAEAPLK